MSFPLLRKLLCIHSINSDANFFMVLPFINISDTYNFDVVKLEESDDEGSDVISIPEEIGFPFGNASLTSLYVSRKSFAFHYSTSIFQNRLEQMV